MTDFVILRTQRRRRIPATTTKVMAFAAVVPRYPFPDGMPIVKGKGDGCL
jgi:hypothetical protein